MDDELPVRWRAVRDCAGHRLGGSVAIDYAASGTLASAGAAVLRSPRLSRPDGS